MKDPRFAKFVVLVNGAVPLGMLAWDAYSQQLGPNPTNDAIHITGVMAIIFISLTLAVTPVRKITGWNWLSHFRRMLGLFAFFYACVHLSLYFAFQRSFSVTGVIENTEKRPFIFFGMAALVLMIPLAITSTNGMIKALGARKWKRLHQLVYFVAIAAAIHFWMNGKVVGSGPKIFAGIVAVLLASRIVLWQSAQMRKPRAVAET
jgi:DMSO/TMAO reductase YedYZ heme-binding membrane subunit